VPVTVIEMTRLTCDGRRRVSHGSRRRPPAVTTSSSQRAQEARDVSQVVLAVPSMETTPSARVLDPAASAAVSRQADDRRRGSSAARASAAPLRSVLPSSTT
jgi:hypothetical protein